MKCDARVCSFNMDTGCVELLAEQGCTVTDLEMMKEFCADLGSARKICVTESIYAHGITPVTEVKVTEIREGAVLGEKNTPATGRCWPSAAANGMVLRWRPLTASWASAIWHWAMPPVPAVP